MTLIGRVGQFFLFLGVISLLIFIGTDQANKPQFALCFVSMIALALGAVLISRGLAPGQPDERFRALRRAREKAAEKRKEKEP